MVNEFDFGRTQFNLKKIIDERGISVKQMAKELGVSYNILERYYAEDVKRFDVIVMTKICYYLDIEYNDIFTYVPPVDDDEE